MTAEKLCAQCGADDPPLHRICRAYPGGLVLVAWVHRECERFWTGDQDDRLRRGLPLTTGNL